MGEHKGRSSLERIRLYLTALPGEYPLNNYFPAHSPAEAETDTLGCPASQRETIRFMETDDDIRYTVIGQKVLLAKGRDFSTLDVMQAWLSELPYRQVCTAETQAYRNFIIRYDIRYGTPPREYDWAWVATDQNPFREWIGAQIRADSWGYAAPGLPELAATFAWRDARMSHVKNGIYGEMFVAAMIAAGFALTDPLQVVRAGLAEIPCQSRLYADMEKTIAICERHNFDAANFEAVFAEIHQFLGHYNPVHTINNAALVVAALLLGRDDFEKVITLAVMGGWDTDCNGATAGSIFGAMFGADAIPDKWKAPLNDTLYSQIFNYHPIAISECARRSTEIARRILG
jgi:ADP-ribosylglycohydrolase